VQLHSATTHSAQQRHAAVAPQVEAFRSNVVCPNKHLDAEDRLYKGRLLASETYIGGKVEAIESGVFRADLPCKFAIQPEGYQALLDRCAPPSRGDVWPPRALAAMVNGGCAGGTLSRPWLDYAASGSNMALACVAQLDDMLRGSCRLDRDLKYGLEVECKVQVEDIEDYDEVRDKIAAALTALRDEPNRYGPAPACCLCAPRHSRGRRCLPCP
jgi:hypothetical protein